MRSLEANQVLQAQRTPSNCQTQAKTACSVCASVHQTQGHMLSSSCIVQIPAQTVSLLVHHMTQIWSQQLQKLVQQLLRQLHCLLDQLLLLDLLWNVKTG